MTSFASLFNNVAVNHGDTLCVTRCSDIHLTVAFKKRCLTPTPEGFAADKLSQRFGRYGYAYALLTTKCADDGTSSSFVASSSSRYDVDAVSLSATSLSPAPFLLTGGFSRRLWNATVASGASFVEFESGGRSAYSETCEYPREESLSRRVSLLMDRLDAKGERRYLLTVVATGNIMI